MDNKVEYKSTSKRPYLVRAYYDWLLDNDFTPYLVVDATYYGVDVPQEYVRDGQIILNIAPEAIDNLALGNNAIEFNARFQGVPRDVYIPLGAVLALYARENADGIMFEHEDFYDEMDRHQTVPLPKSREQETEKEKSKSSKPSKPKSASHLRIIK